jgi:hypothetical protein
MTAPPTGTFETYAARGNREDLTEAIYNIDPTDTPFLSGIEVTEATGVKHEWQTDALAAAVATNYVEEGLDATGEAATATVRLSNTCQISDKVPRVSGTQQAVLKAGRNDELEYQVAKRSKELKRDMESSHLANNAEVTGSSGTPRELGRRSDVADVEPRVRTLRTRRIRPASATTRARTVPRPGRSRRTSLRRSFRAVGRTAAIPT